jgi:hypothetical protein
VSFDTASGPALVETQLENESGSLSNSFQEILKNRQKYILNFKASTAVS